MTSRPSKSAEKAALISPEDKARIDMLIIQVHGLVPADQEEVLKQQLKTLHESFLAACTVETVLSYAIENFMDSCLESRSLCEKFAIVFHALSDVVIGQVKVRSVILTCLQNNFSNLKQLQETNNKHWLNSIALFVAIFHHVRYANGQHLIMLASFVIQALQPLLSGDEAEMRLLAESVISNGQVLREGAPEDLDQLLVDTRTTLIQRNLSSECRLWLLLTADVAEVHFGPLRTPILNFYKEHLGNSIQPILERGEKNKWVVIPDNPTEETTSKSPTSPKSPKSPTSENVPLRNTTPEKSERRGHESKVSPKSKDDLVNKIQGVRINSSEKCQLFAGAIGHGSKTKAHWCHDDRFSSSEYEAPRPRPDRGRGNKTPESPEKSERSERTKPERTKIPEGNWRQHPSKESRERVQTSPKIQLPPCEEVWD